MPVSRETEERFETYVALLARWRKTTNLISPDSFASVWTRHLADSAQIKLINPRAIRWIDVGSGAGFPGIVLGIQLGSVKGAEVHCIESDQRKCAFLRELSRATCAPVTVHCIRIESIAALGLASVDGITARAYAPLSSTVKMASMWLDSGAVGVFPRGRTIAKQLGLSYPNSHYRIEVIPSVVDPTASLLKITNSLISAVG